MKIPKNGNKQFESCPPFEGRAVCVDCTEPEMRMTKFGNKLQFKLVFEVDKKKSDGKPFCVWSKWFTPSSHEKSTFRQFLKDWMGRDMTEAEWEVFDTEDLISRPARIIVVNEHEDDSTFANIKLILPHRASDGEPLKPSGTFVRKKNRDQNGNDYKRTQPATDSATSDSEPAAEQPHWGRTKVHVGKFKGHELVELADEAVQGLISKWLPTAQANPKPTADDKRLMFALGEYQKMAAGEAAAKADDDLPY